jgi:hypothetical protein
LGKRGRFDIAGEMFVLRVSIGGVKGAERVALVEEETEETRAGLPGSDSESFDCPILSGDGSGL